MIDLFQLIERAGGTGSYHFDADPVLWDEMIARGAIVRPDEISAPAAGHVRELAWLHIGKATLYTSRTRKMTRSELETRQAALAREAEQLAMEPPIDIDRERDAKDKWRGVA